MIRILRGEEDVSTPFFHSSFMRSETDNRIDLHSLKRNRLFDLTEIEKKINGDYRWVLTLNKLF